MMTNTNKTSQDKQFNALTELFRKRNSTISHTINKNHKIIFNHLFAINLLQNRPELKPFLKSSYSSATLNFLIEAYIALLNNEKNGSQFLLRSAIENTLKTILDSLNLKINNRSFSINKKTLDNNQPSVISSFSYNTLKSKSSSLQRFYSNFSKTSHSFTTIDSPTIYENFKSALFDDIIASDPIFTNFDDTLENIFRCYICLSENSLKKWDSEDLKNTLHLFYGYKKTESIIHDIKS